MIIDKAFLYVAVQFFLFSAHLLAALLLPNSTSSVLRVIGLAIAVLGALLVFIAIGEHGRVNKDLPNAVPTPKSSAELVQSGLYRCIRHPIYTGVLAAFGGITLYSGHLAVVVLWSIMVIFFTLKSRFEEQLLQQQYGTAYQDYMTHTGRFLPTMSCLIKNGG